MSSVSPARILVVADDRAVRHLVARLLEEAGHLVTVAEDGGVGFLELRHEEPPFDAVVINSYLPALPASDAIRLARAVFPHAAVLHLDEVCGRPFSMDRLLEAIDSRRAEIPDTSAG